MSGFWRGWLVVWCAGVGVFGLVLAGGANEATQAPVQWVLENLRGPGVVDFNPAMRFSLAVMGCVSIGWAATMLMIMLAAFRMEAGARPLWLGLTVGVSVWFVSDSALSVATGFGLNVIPNVALMASYLAPVLASGALRKPAGEGGR
jgi:hypothetical protein